MKNRIKTAALAAALTGVAMLAGCGQAASSTQSAAGDKYAGLDAAIHDWRADIQAATPACHVQSKDKACQGFEVACKGERAITPDEQAKGVVAKVVVAMSWQDWNPAKAEFRSSPGFAEFTKSAGNWTRSEAPRVNLNTCA